MVKVKFSLGQARKAQSGEVYYTLSLTSVLKGWVVKAVPSVNFFQEKRHSTHCTTGWVHPRVHLDGC